MRKFETSKNVVIFKGLGKVFTSGGDVKSFRGEKRNLTVIGYSLNCMTYDMIANYKILYVVFLDGVAMGGASWYSTQCKFCVVTERTSFSMPETAIGYFNDAGSSFFLSRLAGNFGVFMGMTGYRVKGYDMIKVGLASHYVESSKLDELEMELIKCRTDDEVNQVLDRFASIPKTTDSELDSVMSFIDKCFGLPTVEEIFIALRQNGSEWATKTLKILMRLSPTGLKVTHRSINLGRNLSMRECLKMELRVVMRFFADSELEEGIRAVLIDKDNKPNWKPKTIAEVSDDHVRKFFEPLPELEELKFDLQLLPKL